MSRLMIFGPGWGDPHIAIDSLAKKFTDVDKYVLTYPERGTTKPISKIVDTELYPIVNKLVHQYEEAVYIGHSMGGLIGRELQRAHTYPGLFDYYISIGTPHQGTHLTLPARLLPKPREVSASMADMMPGSKFLESLDRDLTRFLRHTRVMTIEPTRDALVVPHSHCRLPEEKKCVRKAQLAGTLWNRKIKAGHVRVVMGEEIVELINKFLACSPISRSRTIVTK